MFRKEAKSGSGIVWLEDVIRCITFSPVDISADLGKGSSDTVLRTWLALWIVFWGMASGMAEVCPDVPSSFSHLTQTDWEVKWEVKVPLKDVFGEGQRATTSTSTAGEAV